MIQITDATFVVNNEAVPTVPNTINFTEGLGEQTIKSASIGGGNVEPIYANDLNSNFSTIKVDVPSTVDMINLIRQWKLNRNNNVIQIIGETIDGTMTRTFSRAALTGNYEVSLGADGNISLEFKAMPAV